MIVQRDGPFTSRSLLCIHELFDRRCRRPIITRPTGAVSELESQRLRAKGPLGAHRYRGTVRNGAWQIEAAAPRVTAATLAEAIALGEALENGRKLVARDETEAGRIETRVHRALADYFGSNALQRTGAELALKRRDPALFGHLVARVFWMRYPDVWPLQDEDQT